MDEDTSVPGQDLIDFNPQESPVNFELNKMEGLKRQETSKHSGNEDV